MHIMYIKRMYVWKTTIKEQKPYKTTVKTWQMLIVTILKLKK